MGDAFIHRVSQVHRLDYYDMNVKEMQERLKGRSALEASVPLTFEEDEEDLKADASLHLPPVEGERRVDTTGATGVARSRADAVPSSPGRLRQISKTNAQYIESEAGSDDEQGDDLHVMQAIESDELSRADDYSSA